MADNEGIYNEGGASPVTPLIRSLPLTASGQSSSGERWLAIPDQHVLVLVGSLERERVVLLVKPDKLGLQVPYALLKAAHLGNHTRIGTADVAE
jgi:hypothetical protein